MTQPARCPDPDKVHPQRYPYPPDMTGLYIRTKHKVPHPDWPDSDYRATTKRSWLRIGWVCPDDDCRQVVLDPLPSVVPAPS